MTCDRCFHFLNTHIYTFILTFFAASEVMQLRVIKADLRSAVISAEQSSRMSRAVTLPPQKPNDPRKLLRTQLTCSDLTADFSKVINATAEIRKTQYCFLSSYRRLRLLNASFPGCCTLPRTLTAARLSPWRHFQIKYPASASDLS